ncbi:MAG: ETC complex I subunit [Pelagibacteraceae bacterium]|nr:ETC complex I subunit [Pelagibacteraceae bacterium]|tara:strand:+ start:41463 stop:41768 length:306 start_codon:yes stop_codon:yes gene_type:complete
MTIKIYMPTKNSMQSGMANTKKWIAEYISNSEQEKDFLMGWNSSSDTLSQIKLYFYTKDQAIEWAKKNNYQYFVQEPKNRIIKPKNYASNFDINRKDSWTH